MKGHLAAGTEIVMGTSSLGNDASEATPAMVPRKMHFFPGSAAAGAEKQVKDR
jgi:hypothetical protein